MNEPLPLNLTAQLSYRGRGNPPGTHLVSSITNCYPGLEFDIRGMWARIFEHLVFHETQNVVMAVVSEKVDGEERQPPEEFRDLVNLALIRVVDSELGNLPIHYPNSRVKAIERGNALADLIALRPGTKVTGYFQIIPSPYVSDFSSQFENEDGSFVLEADFTIDADSPGVGDPWVSAPHDNAGDAQFIEWDLRRLEEISELWIHPPEGRLRTLFPSVYQFRAKAAEEDDWQVVARSEDFQIEDSEWRWMVLPEKIEARFVRLEIPELVEFGGRFFVGVGEVHFETPERKVELTVRDFFPLADAENRIPAIPPDALNPGELTQSLCSPWLYDYRDCVCFYWAASRPDYVNVDPETGQGHNWTDRNRTDNAGGKPEYQTTPGGSSVLPTRDEFFNEWESKDLLKFQIGGKDEDRIEP